MAEDSALVLVGPDDTVETVAEKVRATGARTVQLLVSEDASALQSLGRMAKLQQSAANANIALLLITSDEQTLAAARLCRVETMGVTGAHVRAPDAADQSYTTIRLPIEPATQFPPAADTLVPDDAPQAPPPRRAPPRRLAPTDDDEPMAPTALPARRTGRGDDSDRRRSDRSGPLVAARPRSTTGARRRVFDDDEPTSRPARRLNPLLIVLPALVLAVIVIGGLFLARSQVSVVVRLPALPTTEQPFVDLVIPLTPDAPQANSAAVQAAPIQAVVVFTATGSVASETSAPNNPARGTVTLYNLGSAVVSVPAGTDFIGTNGQGQEVHFSSDSDVAIPAATTSRQGVNIVTAPGQGGLNITARAPGSTSNIDSNKITQLAFPGQGPVSFNNVLFIEHGPITGGDEKQVRIVTDRDVDQVLAAALTGLDDAAPRTLQAQADGQGGLKIDLTTIAPDRSALQIRGDGQVYELVVTPPVGSDVDPARPEFSVGVRATFSALASPGNSVLGDQLRNAVPQQLAAENKLPVGTAPVINTWRYSDGRLLVSGVLRPDGAGTRLDASQLGAIRSGLLGKTRAEAARVLDALVSQGVISGYQLPDRDRLPSLSFQLDVRAE
jgi:hypothetical protein